MATKPVGSTGPETHDLAENTTERMLGPNPFVGLRSDDMIGALSSLWGALMKNPSIIMEQQAAYFRDVMFPMTDGKPTPISGDKRFSDADWTEQPLYRSLLQGYLGWTRALTGLVDRTDLDTETKQRARFVLSLISDAAAPTNTLLGNPAAMKKTMETHGKNLVAGLKNFLDDMATNNGMPAQVDKSSFGVGRNLAMTAGAVVFQNEVLELIQYQPTTKEVYSRPHLFVPPQINKFYVFDLAPGKSLVEHLLGKGFQVFMVSWRNPTAAQRNWDLGTYVSALREAGEAIRDITGAKDLVVHAACSGAMTAIVLAAVLAADKDSLIHAMTLMVAVLGIGGESQLNMFATADAIEAVKSEVAEKGVLEGSEMGRVFAWMRPNDLIWNYWVNNYLLGNAPPSFDVLYWNNDTTRLPAKFHGALLDILCKGLLLQPGAVKVGGKPVDLGAIEADKFILAGSTDHITPWKSVYQLAQTLGGSNEFVLSSSGHIQSLVNPPGKSKSKYHTNTSVAKSPDDWLARSASVSGTWWDYWAEWLAVRSGELQSATEKLGNEKYAPGTKAPGKYVLE